MSQEYPHPPSPASPIPRGLLHALYAAARRAIDHSLFFAPRPMVVQVLAKMAAEQAELVAQQHKHHSA